MAEPVHDLRELRSAIYEAVKAGDAVGLVPVLRSSKGRDVRHICQCGGAVAARDGDVECLRVLDMFGIKLPCWAWDLAARNGHVDCLAFAVSRGYTLGDDVLHHAVNNGHLACVDFLIEQGLPLKPYMYWGPQGYKVRGGRIEPENMKCFQLMADKGVRIDARSMKAAVECGDLDFVRWLHHHGVPLWKNAVQPKCTTMHRGDDFRLAPRDETVFIPPCRVEGIWKALRYGAVHGAPITYHAKGIFKRMRERSREVLMCFKVMERQGGMALPSALVEEILILADLEIRETMLAPAG